MKTPSVSVIIPAYNSMATLPETLRHLNRQTAHIDEIIVVDSSPQSAQMEIEVLVRDYPAVKTVFLKQKTIPAVARNIGAKTSCSDLLLFIDSDAYPDRNWVSSIVAAYQTGCRLGGGSIALPEFQAMNVLAAAQYYLQFNEFIPIGEKRKVKFAPSCNLFCERVIFDAVGGFPEVRASEDVLFGLKASESYEFWFLPNSKVFHIFGDSWDRFKGNQFLLGKYVALYKKEENKNGVKKYLFNRALQTGALPLIPMYKYALLAKRLLRSDLKNAAMFLGVSPAVLLGLVIWSGGFYNGAISVEGDLSVR